MAPRSTVPPSRLSLLLGAAALAPVVALGAGGASAAGPGDFHDAAGLRMVDGSPWLHEDIRSVDFRFDTGGMVRTFHPSVRVTVPPSYADSPDRRYPVLLLLHGRGGFYQDWTTAGGAVEQTEHHEVIVVSPDGGAGSFYSNANFPPPGPRGGVGVVHHGPGPALRARELPHRARPDGDRRALHGRLGRARPRTALLGPLPLDQLLLGTGGLRSGHAGRRGRRVFLRTGDGPWLNFFDGLEQQPDLQSKLDQIGADIIENAVHPNLERFSGALGEAGIDHDYALVPGATHEWGLWRDSLAEDLPGMMTALSA